MLLGVFAGSEEYFSVKDVDGKEITVPNFGELVDNPIKALCWFLRYGTPEKRDCKKQAPPPPPPPPEKKIAEMDNQLQGLADRYERIVIDLRGVREENSRRLAELEKKVVDSQAETEKKPKK